MKSKTACLRDVISQLKEIYHYAQTITETLASRWLAFVTGECKDKEAAGRIDALLNKQGILPDKLKAAIQDIDIAINRSEQERSSCSGRGRRV